MNLPNLPNLPPHVAMHCLRHGEPVLWDRRVTKRCLMGHHVGIPGYPKASATTFTDTDYRTHYGKDDQ